MEISPTDGERFDVTLRAAERDGANLWSWARGLPFETVTSEVLQYRRQGYQRWNSISLGFK